MEIKQIPLKLVRERAYCDCGGELKYAGYTYREEQLNTSSFGHQCTKCSSVYTLEAKYPRDYVTEGVTNEAH